MTRMMWAVFFALIPVCATAGAFRPSAPQVLMIDDENGAVLFARNAHRPFSPSALTKMMTAEVIFDAPDKGISAIIRYFPSVRLPCARGMTLQAQQQFLPGSMRKST